MEHPNIYLVLYWIVPLLFLMVFGVIFLAAIGKSIGIRYVYMNILLFVFEWGKKRMSKEGKVHDNKKNEDIAGPIIDRAPGLDRQRSVYNLDKGFRLEDIMYYCQDGLEKIIDDTVTQRFDAAELSSWNMLTRTNTNYQFISWRLSGLWFAGWILRYLVLFPFRLFIALFSISVFVCGTFILGLMPDGRIKRWLHFRLSLTSYRIFARAFSAVVTFHNKENRAKGGGICVANHTSPIDIVVLGCDNCYAMIGQKQGGFMGFMQDSMSRAESHVWFNRSESKDRHAVAMRLQNHIENSDTLPILIFPEGTCINNTSIMMFKKGSFEVGGTIYPVAIKYDPRFADPFWNSSKQSLSKHLLMMLTSWALVVDVWYMTPQTQRKGEGAVAFANRVKASIAAQGGLVDLEWDGGVKRVKPKLTKMHETQKVYSEKLKSKMENQSGEALPESDKKEC